MNSDLPLNGIRVIDLSHSWAAPHCGRLLADFGAQVIKVEYARRLCLLRGARKVDRIYDRHAGWVQVNRNKLSITLDLKLEADRESFRELVRISDVLIENSRTGVMPHLGFGYSDLVRLKKDLIVLSMPAFGNSGPYAGYAGYGAVFETNGGIQSLTAYQNGAKPARIKELDVTNGLMGASAVMTALLHHQMTGEGQHIDLSQLEAATHATIGEHHLEKVMNAEQTLPLGNRHRQYAPQGCYRCLGDDRWVAISVRSQTEWHRFCQVLGHPELSTDPRFATVDARHVHHERLDQYIETWSVTKDHSEAMHTLQAAGIPCGAVLDVADLHADPHLNHRDYFAFEAADPASLFMGRPFRMSMMTSHPHRRGPSLGQHNQEILGDLLGRPESAVKPLTEDEIGTAFEPE